MWYKPKQILKFFFLCFSFNFGQYRYNGKWATNKGNCSDPKKLFESITFKQEDVVKGTGYEYWNGTHEYSNKHWHFIDHMNFGHCLTQNIVHAHSIQISILVNSTIFFHTPGMFRKVFQASLRPCQY